jgi:hypothetical protein
MNFLNILKELENIDPEIADRMSPRRAAIKNITSFGSKVAVAALPFAMGTLLNKAYGQTIPTAVINTLNYALKLEYLEAAFYNTAVNTSGLIASADVAALTQIRDHENAHVKFLQTVLGTNAVTQSTQGNNGTYDFTAGGTLPNVFATKDYTTFLIVANAFEDTGVRAYKGAAPTLLGQQVYLTAALQIHSVEARHAAHIRLIRNKAGVNIKPYITGANDTGFAGVNANYGKGSDATMYPAEDNTTQGGIDLTTVTNPATGAKFSATAISQAFDEPLDMATVVSLVAGFGVK